MARKDYFTALKTGLGCALALTGASACGVKINSLVGQHDLVASVAQPRIAELRLFTFNGYLNSSVGTLVATAYGRMDRYCILVNDTDRSHCVWTNATAFPATFDTGVANGPAVLTAWTHNSQLNYISDPVSSAAVIIDTTPPVLASVTAGVSSPTNQTTNWPLTYGAVSETYAAYCLLQNNTDVNNCAWTTGTLPATYTVSSGNGAKTLSFWVQDLAGNISARVDSPTVTVNTTAPSLTSVTIGGSNPTNAASGPLTYGTITGSYASYCILTNDTTLADCTFTTGTLPATLSFGTDGTKTASVWLKDSAGNLSTRVDSNSVVVDTAAPALASATVTDTSPTASSTFHLTYGSVTNGTYASYCILENSTTVGSCTWTAGTVPASFTVSSTENAKVLSVWLKDAAGNISARQDSNSVTLDTTVPVLASATVTNSDPTNLSAYSLTYGAVTGTYANYCILENSTTVGSCSWTSGSLPSSFTVSATNNAKVLSIWLKDAAGNLSTRVDTNSVTYDNSAPVLASASVTNTSPTATTTYNLSYGTVTGLYSKYCILENNTSVASCAWTAALLPSTYTVSSASGAKVLSIWLQDAATNISTRVDTNSVTYTPTVPFAQNWPFTAGTGSSYTFDSAKIEIINGLARLLGTDQTDDDNSATGFGGGNFSGAAVWDATNSVVRLTSGSADPSLDSSWTPRYSNLVGYWKLNGTGAVANGGAISATVGTSGTASGSGLSYIAAKIQTGMNFDGSSSVGLGRPGSLYFGVGSFTASAWVKFSSTTANLRILSDGQYGGSNGFMIQANPGGNTGNIAFGIGGSNGTFFYTTAAINDGNWHFVAVVQDTGASRETIYIDGLSQAITNPGCGTITGTSVDVSGCNYSSNPTDDLYIGSHAGSNEMFIGGIDDVALYGFALTAADIAAIYHTQTATHAGVFTSRVMDALQTGLSWTKLSWVSPIPFGKELPDAGCTNCSNTNSESASDYPAIVGSTGTVGDNNLMSGNVGLWHFDETVAGTAPGGKDFKDDSGQGNDLTSASGVSYGAPGKLASSVTFDGTDNGQATAAVSGAILPTTQLSISAWFKTNSSWNQEVLSVQDRYAIRLTAGTVDFFYYISSGQWYAVQPSFAYNDGQWHHVVATKGAVYDKLYIDGVELGSVPTSSPILYDPTNNLVVGHHGFSGTGDNFQGSIDEIGIWNRALDPKEVLQLYRRGANRVKHQVRICTAADCSDDATGANWKGPDGTNQTYFSELNNNTAALAMSGDVKKSAPSMLFSDFTSPVGTSRYFQYRTVLESDDSGTACSYDGGSTQTWCSPELKSVTVDPTHFDTSSPSVIGHTGVSAVSLTGFVETLGSACASGIGYNLGIGASYSAATWYWWDATANSGAGGWVAADGTVTKSNNASTIAAHTSTFSSTLGTATVYFKAYLKSDGNSKCELDNLELDGTH